MIADYRLMIGRRLRASGWRIWLAAASLAAATVRHAPAVGESLCAEVKLEIRQELTLERQGFDAMMRIRNGITHLSLENVAVAVNFADADGRGVPASSDPANTNALFFIRVDSLSNIADVNGAGTVAPSTTADAHWLIIPSPGAAGSNPLGARYLVGARLTYMMGGQNQTIEVTPDTIIVKPMPRLTLDYFLPTDVYGDDAFTGPIEPPVPFALGLRVRNDGYGTAYRLRLDSGQPRIVENKLGLLTGFQITGSEVNGAAAPNSLLAALGNIAPGASAVARWTMECSLSGRFISFEGGFSHSDELGGKLTALVQSVRTRLMVHDVMVDLPGRDGIRDFLCGSNGVCQVCESDGTDAAASNRSDEAVLTLLRTEGSRLTYSLTVPPTAGPLYLFKTNGMTFSDSLCVVSATRSDGKVLNPANVWLGKRREHGDEPWERSFHLFDVNGGGVYTVEMEDESAVPQPPVLQYIGDKITFVGDPLGLGFMVTASDPNHTVPTLTAEALPSGSSWDTLETNGNIQGTFFWRPAAGQEGVWPVRFTASDGEFTDGEAIRIYVGGEGEATNSSGMPISLTNYVTDVYVATNSAPAWPYASWETAATNMESAAECGLDPARVWVSNGTYTLSRELSIGGSMSLRSVNGASATAIVGSGTSRCVSVLSPGVRLDGFTISGGVAGEGAGVKMSVGGELSDCVVVGNCAVGNGGGVLCGNGASLRNCLVAGNIAGQGGGLYAASTSRVENCTIAGNAASNSGGAWIQANCALQNTIIADNLASNGVNEVGGSGGWFDHCCVKGIAAPGPSNLNANPLFVAPGLSDYRLRGESVCHNSGTNQPWMTSAADVAGNQRILHGVVDMGALECTDLRVGISCGPHGRTSPGGTFWLEWGDSTNVVFTAAQYCFILDISVDGEPAGTFGPGSFEFTCPLASVTQDVEMAAHFGGYLTTNGVPLWWLFEYDLTNRDWIVEATDDQDHDGMDTWEEWTAATDPTNVRSFFQFTGANSISESFFVLRWPSASNRFYDLSRSTNLLLPFAPFATNLPATPPENVHTDSFGTVERSFYRIGVRAGPSPGDY